MDFKIYKKKKSKRNVFIFFFNLKKNIKLILNIHKFYLIMNFKIHSNEKTENKLSFQYNLAIKYNYQRKI